MIKSLKLTIQGKAWMYPLLHATHIGEEIALHAPEVRKGVLVSILNRIGLKAAEPGPGVREFFYLSEPYGWTLKKDLEAAKQRKNLGACPMFYFSQEPEGQVIERIFQEHPDAIISVRLEETLWKDTFRIHIRTDNPYYEHIRRDKEMRE